MPASPTRTWPPDWADTPAVAVIERAIARKRLSHSLLLSGGDLDTLQSVALTIADRLLNTAEASAPFPPEQHPDCFLLRPAKKSRQISADDTRELISKVQVSSVVSRNKVGIIFECDRMNTTSANVFLKTLEEPPRNTTLLLLTTKPNVLLPTIRSRCLHFRFPSSARPLEVDGWDAWKTDYVQWLERLSQGVTDRKAATDSLMAAYGLVARFDTVLTIAAAEVWKKQKATLPDDLTSDVIEAYEVGIANGIRIRLFQEMETVTRDFAMPRISADDEAIGRAFVATVDHLEHAVGLLRVNLNELAVLEDFLLASLRLWSRRS